MTTDDSNDEVLRALRRYRPVGPPPALRAWCLAPPRPLAWPWVAAAVLAIGLAAITHRASDAWTPTALADREQRLVRDLGQWMGGGPHDHLQASLLVEDAMARRSMAAAREATR